MRVLVVDDEILVRIGLKSIIDWESHGHQIVGEAENGEEAYEKVVRLHPDLVITDIKMPVTDGIELIRSVIEYDPTIRIIVLSGFDDYHLVREAMKLGATDYLLKLETDPARVLEVLGTLDTDPPEPTPSEAERVPYQRELLLKRTISGEIDEDEFSMRAGTLGIRLSGEKLSCLILRVGAYRAFAATGERELFRLVQSVKELILESLPEAYEGVCIEVMTGEFALFLTSVEPVTNERRYRQELQEIARTACDLLKRCLGFNFSVRAATDKCCAVGIRRSFDRAVAAFGDGSRDETDFRDADQASPGATAGNADSGNDDFSVLTLKNELLRSLSRHDGELLDSVLDEIVARSGGDAPDGERYGRIASETVFILTEYFRKYELRLESIIAPELIQFATMKRIADRDRLCAWLESVREQLQSYLRDRTHLHPRIIERAKEYMIQHLAEPITLGLIANEIHLSPNYFCSLFKKHEGVGFVEFLNGVRVEEAKRLLKDTDDRIYEIATKVGFQNNHYFNRIFKKHAGHTPTEYRDLNIV